MAEHLRNPTRSEIIAESVITVANRPQRSESRSPGQWGQRRCYSNSGQEVGAGHCATGKLLGLSEISHEEGRFGGINADDFAIKLTDARIITQPKPALQGVVNIPWYSGWMEREYSGQTLRELASALSQARKLEGAEKHESIEHSLARTCREDRTRYPVANSRSFRSPQTHDPRS
jgi:hypothetical protein